MRELPILFSGPMVRAILDGRKTQTRRVVKSDKIDGNFTLTGDVVEITHKAHKKCGDFGALIKFRDFADVVKCPYGQPGGLLWVRETFVLTNHGTPVYRADFKDSHGDFWSSIADDPKGVRWKPSIHMPRSASRINLEITGIRVERLQEISESDCWDEGIEEVIYDFSDESQFAIAARLGDNVCNAKPLYAQLWESINGPGSWDLNPWVWVVEFKRVA